MTVNTNQREPLISSWEKRALVGAGFLYTATHVFRRVTDMALAVTQGIPSPGEGVFGVARFLAVRVPAPEVPYTAMARAAGLMPEMTPVLGLGGAIVLITLAARMIQRRLKRPPDRSSVLNRQKSPVEGLIPCENSKKEKKTIVGDGVKSLSEGVKETFEEKRAIEKNKLMGEEKKVSEQKLAVKKNKLTNGQKEVPKQKGGIEKNKSSEPLRRSKRIEAKKQAPLLGKEVNDLKLKRGEQKWL